jgi:hypothetical protein
MSLTPACELIDHTFEVVVVGAGGAGLRATQGPGRGGPDDRLRHKVLRAAAIPSPTDERVERMRPTMAGKQFLI